MHDKERETQDNSMKNVGSEDHFLDNLIVEFSTRKSKVEMQTSIIDFKIQTQNIVGLVFDHEGGWNIKGTGILE